MSIYPGPCSVYEDPLTIRSIRVKEAIFIDASQAVVVYRRTDEGPAPTPQKIERSSDTRVAKPGTETVERRVVRGPARFVPTAEEWMHEFSWSGVPATGSKTSVQPNVDKFTKLSVIPSQLYHNVRATASLPSIHHSSSTFSPPSVSPRGR